MKNVFYKRLLIVSVIITACFTVQTAFAASLRWFESVGLKDNSAVVGSWIAVAVTGTDGFDSNEEYVAAFSVKQWAENGNYKLVLSKIDFLDSSQAETYDPDEMWEYYADGVWTPISEAENSKLIPIVTFDANTAYLRIRIKPDFFQKADFSEYLDCSLRLTAELLPVGT